MQLVKLIKVGSKYSTQKCLELAESVYLLSFCSKLFSNPPSYTLLAVLLHKLLFSNGLWNMQSSQEDLKTIVYAKVEGAEYYFYGGFGKRE